VCKHLANLSGLIIQFDICLVAEIGHGKWKSKSEPVNKIKLAPLYSEIMFPLQRSSLTDGHCQSFRMTGVQRKCKLCLV